MQLDKVSFGENIPDEFNVIIENSLGGVPVKYEMDKDTGIVIVDRILHTAMYYPGNYGFIPNTLSGDGDPVDALVLMRSPIMPGAMIAVRPVGVLMMEDDGGQDEKILTVPIDKVHPFYSDVVNYTDLRPVHLDQIEHFFTHYKDLEPGKWSKTLGWKDVHHAKKMIMEGVERAKKS